MNGSKINVSRVWWLGLLLLVGVACKEDEAPPPDPCTEAQPFTADFTILEHVGDSLIATDSVLL